MRRSLRFVSSGLLAAGILAALPLTASANTVLAIGCDNASQHCYAIITDGEDKLAYPVNNTLSNLSSGTAVVNSWSMNYGPWYYNFVNNELWLVTPPNPSKPYHSSGWQPEWIESGLTFGGLNDATTGTVIQGFQFFWARNYYSGGYHYYEYHLPGTPSFNTVYVMNIKWNTSTQKWDVYRNGSVVASGVSTQRPPGSNQALQAGAEMTRYSDTANGSTFYLKDCGSVTGLSKVVNGVTTNSWAGNVYRAQFTGAYQPWVFNITSNSNTGISFQTTQGC